MCLIKFKNLRSNWPVFLNWFLACSIDQMCVKVWSTTFTLIQNHVCTFMFQSLSLYAKNLVITYMHMYADESICRLFLTIVDSIKQCNARVLIPMLHLMELLKISFRKSNEDTASVILEAACRHKFFFRSYFFLFSSRQLMLHWLLWA